MSKSANRALRRNGGPRRLLIAAASLGLVAATGAVVDAARDDANGRDPGARPSSDVDDLGGAPAPAPSEVDDGRGPGARAGAPSENVGGSLAPAVLDNGRGGVDPEFGPNPIPRADAGTATVDVGDIDTDSGVPAARDAGDSSGVGETAPADQDVPGAPTMSEPGDDAPANDSDG